jgi:hypothetical protein
MPVDAWVNRSAPILAENRTSVRGALVAGSAATCTPAYFNYGVYVGQLAQFPDLELALGYPTLGDEVSSVGRLKLQYDEPLSNFAQLAQLCSTLLNFSQTLLNLLNFAQLCSTLLNYSTIQLSLPLQIPFLRLQRPTHFEPLFL